MSGVKLTVHKLEKTWVSSVETPFGETPSVETPFERCNLADFDLVLVTD